jgi:hypothetical protein
MLVKTKIIIFKTKTYLQLWRILLCIIFLFNSPSKGHTQSLKRQSIGSAGSSKSETGTTIQQTIGQPYNTTSYYSNEVRYNPGFLQPVFRIEGIKTSISAKIYPK